MTDIAALDLTGSFNPNRVTYQHAEPIGVGYFVGASGNSGMTVIRQDDVDGPVVVTVVEQPSGEDAAPAK